MHLLVVKYQHTGYWWKKYNMMHPWHKDINNICLCACLLIVNHIVILTFNIICCMFNWYGAALMFNHSLETLLRTPSYHWAWNPFPLRTALNPGGIHYTRCWKHSSKILVYVEIIAYLSAVQLGCQWPALLHHKGVLLNWDLITEDHVNTANSLSCSTNQCSLIWASWHRVLPYWK